MTRALRKKTATPAAEQRVPGKIFLCGEHAVVHGYPALLCTLDLYVRCRAAPAPPGRLIVRIGERQRGFETSQAKRRRQHLETLWRQDPHHPLLSPFRRSGFELAVYSALVAGACSVDIGLKSELPPGSGLGSSAAVATAVVSAVSSFGKERLSKEELFFRVQQVERLQHGTPSGADAATCVYGGVLRFAKQEKPAVKRLRLDLSFLHAAVIFTGRPSVSTADTLAFVKRRLAKDPEAAEALRRLGALTSALLGHVRTQQVDQIFSTICEAHGCLSTLGVSNDRADEVVSLLQGKGYAGKLCGAGAHRGRGVGVLLALFPTEVARRRTLPIIRRRFGFPARPVSLGGPHP